MKIKVLICDDDRLITDSLKFILDLDDRFEVVGISNDGSEAFNFCIKHQVDVVLLDIRMPKVNGVEATKEIVSKTSTKVLILTTFDEDKYISDCFKNGAKGYILKNNPPEMIMNAIVAVNGGHSILENHVMDKMKNKIDNKDERLSILTKREIDIVIKIAEGLTNKEISEALFISEGTVKNNITSILSKLNLKHRTQIAIYYLK